jgi:hypothetical protein
MAAIKLNASIAGMGQHTTAYHCIRGKLCSGFFYVGHRRYEITGNLFDWETPFTVSKPDKKNNIMQNYRSIPQEEFWPVIHF